MSEAKPLSELRSSSTQAALCIDRSGLCIGSKGEGAIDKSKSGNFATVLSLASRIGSNPLVTIETDSSAYMMKEYDGNTVVMKVALNGARLGADEGDGSDKME